MCAAQDGGLECIMVLTERGANINAKAIDGETALMEAAENDNVHCVKFLVNHCADVSAKRKDGESALTLARDYPAIIARLKAAGAKE